MPGDYYDDPYYLFYSEEAMEVQNQYPYMYRMSDNNIRAGNFVSKSKDKKTTLWEDIVLLGEIKECVPLGGYNNQLHTKAAVAIYNIDPCDHPEHARYALRGGKQGCYKCSKEDIW